MHRSVAVQRYLVVSKAKGLPADPIFTGSGIDSRKLGEPELLVEPAQCRVVVENLLRISGDNGIGFDVGMNSTLQDLGIFGHAAMTCKTVRDSHLLWGQFGNALVGIMAKLTISHESDDEVTLAFSDQDPRDPLSRFYVEEMLGLIYMIGNPLAGELPTVKKATFAYCSPPHEYRYREIFNCPIYFESGQSAITVGRRWFDRSVRTHDPEFNKLCINHCDKILRRMHTDLPLIYRLRGIFLKSVNSTPRLDEAARELNMSARTLRRRLLEIGTTYRAQFDVYRMEQAQEYFKRPDLTTKEVGYRLGFADPSAFRHAFKAWTGYSIGRYRSQMCEPESRMICRQ